MTVPSHDLLTCAARRCSRAPSSGQSRSASRSKPRRRATRWSWHRKGHQWIYWIGGTMTRWWLTKPLWKIWKSDGMMTFPIYGKMKNVPNHQPEQWRLLEGWRYFYSRNHQLNPITVYPIKNVKSFGGLVSQLICPLSVVGSTNHALYMDFIGTRLRFVLSLCGCLWRSSSKAIICRAIYIIGVTWYPHTRCRTWIVRQIKKPIVYLYQKCNLVHSLTTYIGRYSYWQPYMHTMIYTYHMNIHDSNLYLTISYNI